MLSSELHDPIWAVIHWDEQSRDDELVRTVILGCSYDEALRVAQNSRGVVVNARVAADLPFSHSRREVIEL